VRSLNDKVNNPTVSSSRRTSVGVNFLIFATVVSVAGVSAVRAQLFLPSASNDRDQGAQVARQVEDQIGLVSEPALQDYIRAIGRRLVNEVNDDRFHFSFDIVDQNEPNAFAAPGGYVYISRGLLALVNSEDELACVIAHETIHVTRRHSAKQERRGFLPGLLSVPGNIVGRVVDEDLGRLINSPTTLLGGVAIASYSRSHEREADTRGLKLAAGVGYDPAALATILTRMERAIALVVPEAGGKRPGFFDTHPSTPSRASDIQKEAPRLTRASRPPIASDRADFLRRFDGLILGDNPALGVFQGTRFIHPHLNITLEFPEGWKQINTPRVSGAQKKDGSAALVLGIAGKGDDPEPLGRAFVEKLRDEFRTAPSRAERTSIGTWPAYVVSITDTTSRSRSEMHFVWAAHEGTVFQLIGLGKPQDLPVLKACALSLREATADELNKINVRRLSLAASQPGETLKDFCQRNSAASSPELTALANDLSVDSPLTAGHLLKFAKTEPYVAHP
jgi:predicted Zn-dependent protease